MVSDGMGFESFPLARLITGSTEKTYLERNYLHKNLIPQTSRPKFGPFDDTSIACGMNTDNIDSVGLFSSGLPCGSILEAAKQKGYKTGLVATSRITDDTPAAFSAHIRDKKDEDSIAVQQLGGYPLGPNLDLMIGGGRCHFLPASKYGGCRRDSNDLWQIAKDHGWTVAENVDEYNELGDGHNVSLPLMALLAPGNLPFEIDREDDKTPSLESITKTALNALAKDTLNSPEGFFLVIEGSRIDHAAHDNDPVTLAHEVLAYDRAFKAVLDFIDTSDTNTILLSTSNHETGGLKVHHSAKDDSDLQHYSSAIRSSSFIANTLNQVFDSQEAINDKVKSILQEYVGKSFGFTPEEIAEISNKIRLPEENRELISRAISQRLPITWKSQEHTIEPVGIYGHATPGPDIHRLWKQVFKKAEHIQDIPRVFENFLGVKIGPVTHELNQVQDDDPPPIHGSFRGVLENIDPEDHWTGKIWLKSVTEADFRCPGKDH